MIDTIPDTSLPETTEDQNAVRSRLLSLDVFRGLTVLGMILVNNPGSWSTMVAPLEHADWHGWTPTDLIFPFFLFIVGTSISYSLRKYRAGGQIDRTVYWRIARRTILLILLGWLPGLLIRAVDYFNGTSETFDLDTLRLPGVLVRIALVYLAASLIALHVSIRGQAILASVILIAYWALLTWLPNPHHIQANLSPEGNVVRVVDRAVFGDRHLYTQAKSVPTDPEGLLSTFPAIVTALLGYWTGLAMQRRNISGRTVVQLIAAGAVCVVIGLVWDGSFPINKKIWTSSFVLLTGGLAMSVLAGCLMIFDVWALRTLARPFEIVGINAIFVFVASGLLAVTISHTHVGNLTTKEWLYNRLFTSWITDPKLASLGFALATVGFWWLVLWAFAKRGWSIRV